MMIRHMNVRLPTGVDMHVVEGIPNARLVGSPTLLMVHGFPDTWYGWRHQLKFLSEQGYHVIVPDGRGYGETKPVFKEVAKYSNQAICEDLIALMDALLLDKVVLCGHDWGGSIVYALTLHFPERILGVASFCTPHFPWKNENPYTKMKANPGRFDYQLYFHEKAAEEEFEKDYERTVKCMIRGTSAKDVENLGEFLHTPWRPTQDGGALVKYPDDVQKSEVLSNKDVQYYAWQFKQTGFFGILSWYRNIVTNWKWNKATAGKRITVPTLMVTAELDPTLPPSMVKYMQGAVDDLAVENIKGAGHWVLQEKPVEANAVLLRWLQNKFPNAAKL